MPCRALLPGPRSLAPSALSPRVPERRPAAGPDSQNSTPTTPGYPPTKTPKQPPHHPPNNPPQQTNKRTIKQSNKPQYTYKPAPSPPNPTPPNKQTNKPQYTYKPAPAEEFKISGEPTITAPTPDVLVARYSVVGPAGAADAAPRMTVFYKDPKFGWRVIRWGRV